MPGAARDAATETRWFPRQPPATVTPRRVLIVEDEAALALQLKMLVENQGHSVSGPAASLKRALILIQEDDIHAALLDIRLADGDSIPAAELLQKRNIREGAGAGVPVFSRSHAHHVGFRIRLLPSPIRPRKSRP
jgi:DNA-binding response OmpR family regulator